MARGRGRRGGAAAGRGEGRGRPVTRSSTQADTTPAVLPPPPVSSSQVPIPPTYINPADMARFYADMYANFTANPYFMAHQNTPTDSGTHNQTPPINPIPFTVPNQQVPPHIPPVRGPIPLQQNQVTENAPQPGDTLLLEYMKEFARLQPLNFIGSTSYRQGPSQSQASAQSGRVYSIVQSSGKSEPNVLEGTSAGAVGTATGNAIDSHQSV